MRRTIWIVVLAAGTVLGFGAGFAHLCGFGPAGHGFYRHGPHGRGFGDARHWEDRAADACVRAAERVMTERHSPPPPAASPPPAPPASAL